MTLGNELGLTQNETRQVYYYLKSEGLLVQGALGGRVRLSHEGIREVEQALTNWDRATDHFPVNIINIYGGLHNSPIQQGTTGSQQTIELPVPMQAHQQCDPNPLSSQTTQLQQVEDPSYALDKGEFIDIRIVGFDEVRSHKLPNGALEAFIELSAEPPLEWTSLLRSECQMPRGTLCRPLDHLEGRFLILHDAYGGSSISLYLEGLKQDIQNANQSYRGGLESLQRVQARKSEQERREREDVARLKSQLDID